MSIKLFNPDVYRFASVVSDVVRNGFVGPGGRTASFEALFAKTVGMRHAIATTSGTTALMLSLLSLDLEPGSTILCPAYGMCAGANVARLLGFKVRLIDVDLFGNMDASKLCGDGSFCDPLPDIADYMNDVSACIFIDHNGGLTGIESLIAQCDKYCVPVIEDACQGLGCDGAGTFGRLACFSFSPQKLLTTGQGGMVVTNDDHLAGRVRQIIDHGGDWRKDRVFQRPGGNFRFNDILASLGLAQLAEYDQLRRARQSVRLQYHAHECRIGSDDGWCVLFPSRDPAGLVAHLAGRGVEAARLYPPAVWSPLHADGRAYPGAEAVWNRDVYLPGHSGLQAGDVEFVCQAVREFEGE